MKVTKQVYSEYYLYVAQQEAEWCKAGIIDHVELINMTSKKATVVPSDLRICVICSFYLKCIL